MIKSICVAMLLLSSTSVIAQESSRALIPTQCGETTKVVESLKKQNQKLIFFAKDDNGLTMIYRNPSVTDWFVTITSSTHPERTCIVMDGLTSETIIPQTNRIVPEREVMN